MLSLHFPRGTSKLGAEAVSWDLGGFAATYARGIPVMMPTDLSMVDSALAARSNRHTDTQEPSRKFSALVDSR